MALDFAALHTRECRGVDEPDSGDSDYEIWIPKNFRGDGCKFGKQIKYVRRKRGACCFNSESYDKK